MSDRVELELKLQRFQEQLRAIENGWPFLLPVLKERREKFVQQLVVKEDPVIRGRIQELDQIMNLAGLITPEIGAIQASLSDMDGAES